MPHQRLALAVLKQAVIDTQTGPEWRRAMAREFFRPGLGIFEFWCGVAGLDSEAVAERAAQAAASVALGGGALPSGKYYLKSGARICARHHADLPAMGHRDGSCDEQPQSDSVSSPRSLPDERLKNRLLRIARDRLASVMDTQPHRLAGVACERESDGASVTMLNGIAHEV